MRLKIYFLTFPAGFWIPSGMLWKRFTYLFIDMLCSLEWIEDKLDNLFNDKENWKNSDGYCHLVLENSLLYLSLRFFTNIIYSLGIHNRLPLLCTFTQNCHLTCNNIVEIIISFLSRIHMRKSSNNNFFAIHNHENIYHLWHIFPIFVSPLFYRN